MLEFERKTKIVLKQVEGFLKNFDFHIDELLPFVEDVLTDFEFDRDTILKILGFINEHSEKIEPLLKLILTPLFHWFFKYGCAKCGFRFYCLEGVLSALDINVRNIFIMMETNSVKHIHPNWVNVLKELERVWCDCQIRSQGGYVFSV